ncbi:WD40 repeat domain-containing protein [Streptomyces nigra]|uniref:WD40 repeat domain-containing protein n=1 Tax=Streptomyces nigra TaxID=1827580 RepID=UPI0035DA3694
MAATGTRGLVRLWDAETGEPLKIFHAHRSDVFSLCLGGDGTLILSAGMEQVYGGWHHTVRLWDTQTGTCVWEHVSDTAVHAVRLSADGRFALSGSWDGTVRLWDVTDGSCLHTLRGHTGEVAAAVLSADGRFAVSGGDDRVVRLWEIDWELDVRRPAGGGAGKPPSA